MKNVPSKRDSVNYTSCFSFKIFDLENGLNTLSNVFNISLDINKLRELIMITVLDF